MSVFYGKLKMVFCTVALGGSMFAHADLVGLYRFNDVGTPGSALDSSVSGNDGTVAGATFTADGTGASGLAGDSALSFDGDDVVTLPSVAPLAGITANNALTVSLWAFGVGQPRQDVLFNFGGVAPNPRQALVHLPWSDNRVYFDTGGGTGGGQRLSALSDPSDTNGTWSHWAFVKDGNDKFVYLNGSIFAQKIGTDTDPFDPIISAFIGAATGAGAQGYTGQIDDFALFDHAVTSGEVATIMSGDFSAYVIPEPGTLALLAVGVGACLLRPRFGRG